MDSPAVCVSIRSFTLFYMIALSVFLFEINISLYSCVAGVFLCVFFYYSSSPPTKCSTVFCYHIKSSETTHCDGLVFAFILESGDVHSTMPIYIHMYPYTYVLNLNMLSQTMIMTVLTHCWFCWGWGLFSSAVHGLL